MVQSKQQSTYLHFELFNFIFLQKFKILWKIDYQLQYIENTYSPLKSPKNKGAWEKLLEIAMFYLYSHRYTYLKKKKKIVRTKRDKFFGLSL